MLSDMPTAASVTVAATVQHAFGGLERGLFFKQLTDCPARPPTARYTARCTWRRTDAAIPADAANHAVQRTDQSPTGTEPDVGQQHGNEDKVRRVEQLRRCGNKIVDISYLHVFPRIVRNAR